ncbi:MAG: IS200/IS605 family transposase [Acidobacteriia bacterium]|nr:IS200/IS605 family transposase [Terriglobia bacterium]
MAHTFTTLHTHVIFSTKDRAPFLDAKIRSRDFAYMGGMVREMRGTAAIVNGVSDHVHMLVQLPAEVALAECLRVVKTNSSRWVHETWPDRKKFAWQTGYGASSVSTSNVPVVTRYIERQQEHHEKVSFQDEFIAFLRKNGIAFDPEHLWD